MMRKEEFEFILQEGEGLKIEFKENFDSKNLSKEIVAFANTEGGRIFIGVTDKGEIKGIQITNKLKSQIQDLARNCDPSIKIELEVLDNILIVNVNEGINKPYRCSAGFFLRQGSNSQKLSTDEIGAFFNEEGKILFDERRSCEKAFDSSLVERYLLKAGINERVNKSLLVNLSALTKEGFLNNAGVLFFTNNPRKIIKNAYITCARYKGIEKVNIIDRKDFDEDLITQVEQALEFVQRNTRLEYEIKGLSRKEIPEYPLEAIREAILNAVMHRDYLKQGANVQVDIFDDRLTITNIGGLIKPLTKEKLGTLAVRRNPLIADLFHRIHFVEKMGTGIKRIRDACEKHGNVKFEVETNGYFIATFRLRKTVEKSSEKILALILENKENPKMSRKELGVKLGERFGVKLGENEAEIIRKIAENKFITALELSKYLAVSLTAVENNISKLKQKNILKRVGPDKGGYWEIFKK